MSPASFFFSRSALALAWCDSLDGRGIANLRSGLFLAGPRRVGKTTFLQHDLLPEAERRGWAVVYVDLWADRNADPAQLIGEAINRSYECHRGLLSRLVGASGGAKLNVMGTLEMDFSPAGESVRSNLVDALRQLRQTARRPVLLIIDEAQHALRSPSGLNAMFSIKSARDQLNCMDEDPALMLVLTGSSRDKLAQLVLKRDQPFFGSQITEFPLLDHRFTDAFTEWVNRSLAVGNQFSRESLWQAFQRVGHRPEILRELAGDIAIRGSAGNLIELLRQDVDLWHGRIWREYEAEFLALTPLQQAVLIVLVEKGQGWAPYADASMTAYKQKSGLASVKMASVQTAIQMLRERELIWQSGRGTYALEDESFGEWLRHAQGKGGA